MNLFSYFQHLNLTKDQRSALEKIEVFLENNDRIFVLQGYAGSGKTTLLKGIVEYLNAIEKKHQLMAPTGRAAKVIHQKSGLVATTIHKGIYSFEELHEIDRATDGSDVSFLYEYKLRNNKDAYDSVFIVDEASMVSDAPSEQEFFRFGSGRLLFDLVKYSRVQEAQAKSKIIFLGDPAQLPPIGMNFSPALDPEYLTNRYQVTVSMIEMKEVKRQNSTNGILLSATRIRRCLTSGYFNHFDFRGNKEHQYSLPYHDFLSSYKAVSDQKVIICYKNKTALDLNTTIRKEKFGHDLPIQATDIIIVGGNNYPLGILNGEFGTVVEVSATTETRDVTFYLKGGGTKTVTLAWRKASLLFPDDAGQTKVISGLVLENYIYGDASLRPEEQRALYIDFKNRHSKLKKGSKEFKEAISTDPYFNCIFLKYGYAVTCHKAQGGEWPNAFVFWDMGVPNGFNFYEAVHNTTGKTNAGFYRWAYTAVTRASNNLFCINPPYFSPFSRMAYVDINVLRAYNDLTGSTSEPVEIALTDRLAAVMAEFNLESEHVTIQDHFISRWYHLQEQSIEITGWQRLGYEIRYVFQRDNRTAALKYWVNGKGEVNQNFQRLPGHTNSDELFEVVVNVVSHLPAITVKRTNARANFENVKFDADIEERKPFLRQLFDEIRCQLRRNEVITNVEHLSFRDRYIIEKDGAECVIDFEYNNEGFFGRVLPMERRCNSMELLSSIRTIVDNLKRAEYVSEGN